MMISNIISSFMSLWMKYTMRYYYQVVERRENLESIRRQKNPRWKDQLSFLRELQSRSNTTYSTNKYTDKLRWITVAIFVTHLRNTTNFTWPVSLTTNCVKSFPTSVYFHDDVIIGWTIVFTENIPIWRRFRTTTVPTSDADNTEDHNEEDEQ